MQQSMLFILPAELRNQIYHYLVVEDGTIDMLRLDRRKDTIGYELSLTPEPVLARTCKALRMEVLSFYYSENLFIFGTGAHVLTVKEATHALSRWFSRPLFARFLRRIEMDVNCEILGPRNAAYSLRDFWEVLHLSIQDNGHDVEVELVGDPLIGDLCVCEANRQARRQRMSKSPSDMLAIASRLYLTTTEYGECDECQRPRLTEARKVNGAIYICDVE